MASKKELLERIKAIHAAKALPESEISSMLDELDKMPPDKVEKYEPTVEDYMETNPAFPVGSTNKEHVQRMVSGIGKGMAFATPDPYVALAKYGLGKTGFQVQEPVTTEDLKKYIPGTKGEAPTTGKMLAGSKASPFITVPLDIASSIGFGAASKIPTKLRPSTLVESARGVRDYLTGKVYPYFKNILQEEIDNLPAGTRLKFAKQFEGDPEGYVKAIKEFVSRDKNPVDILSKHGLLLTPEKAAIGTSQPMSLASERASKIIQEASEKGATTPWIGSGKLRYKDKLDKARELNLINQDQYNAAMAEGEHAMGKFADYSLEGIARAKKQLNKDIMEARKPGSGIKPLVSGDIPVEALEKTQREMIESGISSTLPEKLGEYKAAQKEMSDLFKVLPDIREQAFAKTPSSGMQGLGSAVAASAISPKWAAAKAGSMAWKLVPDSATMWAARLAEDISKSDRARSAIMSPYLYGGSRVLKNWEETPETKRVNK